MRRRRWSAGLATALILAGCDSPPEARTDVVASPSDGPANAVSPAEGPSPAPRSERGTGANPSRTPSPAGATSVSPSPDPHARPDWLGTRVVEYGDGLPTPPELRDRRLRPPPGGLPDPDRATFDATIEPVPDTIRERSTWRPACPVGVRDLRYVTLTFWGFDEQPHTGELLVHREAADDLVEAFRLLYAARFPIEEMRIVAPGELEEPPTGDGNNTTAFVCRPVTGGSGWSQHAYGLAVDINPFHNPYRRGDTVLPELATAYLDRGRVRPGMILDDDDVVAAFDGIGWGWGGDFDTLEDWQHFSREGR